MKDTVTGSGKNAGWLIPQHLSYKNSVRTDSRSQATNHTRYILNASLMYYCYTSHLIKNTAFSHISYTFTHSKENACRHFYEFVNGLLSLKEKVAC